MTFFYFCFVNKKSVKCVKIAFILLSGDPSATTESRKVMWFATEHFLIKYMSNEEERYLCHYHLNTMSRLYTGRVGPFVARSLADREVLGWFDSYTGQTWISQGTRNESKRPNSTKMWFGTLRGLCLYKYDISWSRMLAAHKTGRPER